MSEQLSEDAVFRIAFAIESSTLRDEYLRQVSLGSPALYGRVNALLDASREEPEFLESSPVAVERTFITPQPTEAPGTMIGPYKIREQLGEGGMGVVYVADQTEPVRRRVALKVIKPGMDSKEIIGRFQAERQTLAIMSHPNIAKVLDGGTTENGRPYFVMELVKGIPITEFCDQQKLNIRERLELFTTVCQAVQHAHMKGIIHRDLKPSNVMVELHDVVAVPKVIDFGIAKATNQQLTQQTVYTQFSQLVGTPLYMSPEQAQVSGIDIDTRSDVYSLGVMLYELLTGVTPFDKSTLSSVGVDEMRRIIREDEPLRPSNKVSTLEHQEISTISASRQSIPREMSLSMQQELDWIVMKALEKDRTRRYESANALAADLQRYLDDEPVEACPPSVAYRLKKLARRNRVTIATTALVAIALILGIVGTTMQAVRATKAEYTTQTERDTARRQRDRAIDAEQLAGQQRDRAIKAEEFAQTNFEMARETVDSMLDLVKESSLAGNPELAPLRTGLLETSKSFYNQLLFLKPKDSMSHLRRGLAQEQLHHYEEALEDLKQAVALDPDNDLAHSALAQFYWLCQKTPLREPLLAEKHALKAVSLKPDNSGHWLRLGQVRKELPGKRKLAHEAYDRAIELDPENVSALVWRSLFLPRDRALEDLHKAISLSSNSTETGEAYRLIAVRYRDSKDYEKALENYALAEEFDRYNIYVFEDLAHIFKILGDSEKSFQNLCSAIEVRPQRSFAYKRRAVIYFQREDYDNALSDLNTSLDINPNDASAVWWIPSSDVASCSNKDFQAGMKALANRAVELNNQSSASLTYRASLFLAFGELEQARKDLDAATTAKDVGLSPLYYAALLSIATDSSDRYPELCQQMLTRFTDSDVSNETHFTAWTCALAPAALKDYAPAIKLARQAVEQESKNQQYHNGLGAILMRAGEFAEAKENLEQALAAAGSANTSTSYTRYFLAMTEQHLGNAEAAQTLLKEANTLSEKELADSPRWNRKLTLELLRKEAESLIKIATNDNN